MTVATNNANELSQFLVEYPETRYVDAIFVDLCGIVRGKRIPREDSDKIYDGGVQIPHWVYLLDVTGYNAVIFVRAVPLLLANRGDSHEKRMMSSNR